MSKQTINYGTVANDPAADSVRTAFNKAQDNFDELYHSISTLTADVTGSNNNSAQPWFPGAGVDTLTVLASTSYWMDGQLTLTRAAGGTSHTTGILFGGTATFTSIGYVAQATTTTGNVLGTVSAIRADAATEVIVTAASTSTTENITVSIRGIIRINAGGTLVPQFKYSTAPGGAPTIKANSSYFGVRKLGTNTFVSEGSWA